MIAPLNLTFAQVLIRDAQWPAFRNRNRLESSPENFAELMTAVATFLKPVVTAIRVDTPLLVGPSALVLTPRESRPAECHREHRVAGTVARPGSHRT